MVRGNKKNLTIPSVSKDIHQWKFIITASGTSGNNLALSQI